MPCRQGFKGGDFFAPFAKKYYPSLDGGARRSGKEKKQLSARQGRCRGERPALIPKLAFGIKKRANYR
jgi:hypothetical protein